MRHICLIVIVRIVSLWFSRIGVCMSCMVEKEKEKLIERLDSVMHIDEVLEHLKERVLQGDIRAIKLWLEYRYGRPNTTVAMETTTTNINFKELINWE